MAIDLWVSPPVAGIEEADIVLKVCQSVRLYKVPKCAVVVGVESIMLKRDVGSLGKCHLDYHPEGWPRDVSREVGPVHTGSLLFERRDSW